MIENLHLADNYILEIDQMIAKLDSESTHKNFRLFLSSVQMDNCPHMILKQSVKVALQQPSGIKLKMERHIDNFEAEPIWRKG